MNAGKNRKWITAAALVLALFSLTGLGCGMAGTKVINSILNNRPDMFAKYFPMASWCGNGLPFVSLLPRILDGSYVVLLQNNTEIRATGGFAGSFAKLDFAKGGLRSVLVQDIYDPDGKLPGHVEPPYPIQEAFGQGWWKLRDANWDVDFASAGATVSWFLRQGGEKNVDGVIAVNLDLLQKWIGVFGEVKVSTFEEKVTATNLYSLAQAYAERRVEGNKTEKRQFLGALGAALMERTKAASKIELLALGKLVVDELNNKQIMVWMKDHQIQSEVERMRWGGRLKSDWSGAGDYIYVVDTNLGANKSDCCIERMIEQKVEKIKEGVEVEVKIVRKNNNPYSIPKPPESWGGQYVDYVRVVIPKTGISLGKVMAGEKELKVMKDDGVLASLRQGRSEGLYAMEERDDMYIVGFWLVVDAGGTGEATITYQSNRSPDYRYELFIKRQPGVSSFNYMLDMKGQTVRNQKIDKDMQFKISWK
jgi:hypothetical protein